MAMFDWNNNWDISSRVSARGSQKITTRSGWGNIPGYAWVLLAVFGFGVMLIEQAGVVAAPREVAMRLTEPSIFLAEKIRNYQQRGYSWWQFIQHGAEHLAQAEYEISQLSLDAAYIHTLEEENRALQKEVGRTLSDDWVLAEWYGSPAQWFVDVGCRDGIVVGSVVTKDRAFVGIVSAVFDRYSEVRTWDDPSWRLAVKVGSESARGVFSVGGGYPEVSEVPMAIEKSEYLVGESVVTAGQDHVPANRLLGKVLSSQSEPGFGTVRLVVDPVFDFSDIQFVSVVRENTSSCDRESHLNREESL